MVATTAPGGIDPLPEGGGSASEVMDCGLQMRQTFAEVGLTGAGVVASTPGAASTAAPATHGRAVPRPGGDKVPFGLSVPFLLQNHHRRIGGSDGSDLR